MRKLTNDKIFNCLKVEQNLNDVKFSSSSIIQTEVLDTQSISKSSHNTENTFISKSCAINLEKSVNKPQRKIAIDFVKSGRYDPFYKKQNDIVKIKNELYSSNRLCKCDKNFTSRPTIFEYYQKIILSFMVFLMVILITFILNFFQASINL